MSIRILGGLAKGMQLAGPKSSQIRPTSVMLKRRLFDSIQHFDNYLFVDLCAGTGSIGLEALSRGAREVICVDKSAQAINLLKQNQKQLAKFGIDPAKLKIIKSDALTWLQKNFSNHFEQPTLVFYDPPYEMLDSYSEIYQYFAEGEYSIKLIMEGCSQKTLPLAEFLEKFPGSAKTFQQGTSFFVIYDFE